MKFTLKQIYNIAYNFEEPFQTNKNVGEFLFSNISCYLTQCRINGEPNVRFIDAYCYLLDKLGISLNDLYEHLTNKFESNIDIDVELYNKFPNDGLFEECRGFLESLTDEEKADFGIFTSDYLPERAGYKKMMFIVNPLDYTEQLLKKFDNQNEYVQKLKMLLSVGQYKEDSKYIKEILNVEDLNINALRENWLVDCDNEITDRIVVVSRRILGITNKNEVSKKEPVKISDNEKETIKANIKVNPTEIYKNLQTIDGQVIGQAVALSRVKSKVLGSLVGFKSEGQPLATFLLTGPTGVGKTETAKAVADACFDKNIYVVDMTTFKHESDVSRLLGASPGYVGYNDTNSFCTFLKEHPSSVILFDEIEKADSGCLDLLMRMLDEGKFINAKGEEISLENTVIFCTTNMSKNKKKTVGFETGNLGIEEELSSADGFRKEILGRFSDIIEYRKLEKEDCKKIAEEIFIKKLINGFEKNNQNSLKIEYDKDLLDLIIKEANTDLFGARDLKRAIQKHFVAPISYYIMENSPQKVTLVVGKNGVKIKNGGELVLKEKEVSK